MRFKSVHRRLQEAAADRVLDSLDAARAGRAAWIVAAAGALATLAGWWIAVTPEIREGANLDLLRHFFNLSVIAAPFVTVYAGWHALAPTHATTTEEIGVMAGYAAQAAADRQRRMRLVAALAGVLNAAAMIIVTG